MSGSRRNLFDLLGELAATTPKLVLMRGEAYYRIEDLWRFARKDWNRGDSEARAALSEMIYWTEVDGRGKLLLKGITPKGDEFVSFVEPGSEVQTTIP